MSLTPSRIATTLTAVTVCGVLAPSPAQADGWSRVDCEQQPDHADCQVEAGTQPAGSMSAPSSGEMVCRLDGEVVPCVTDDGWLGSDGCRYLRLDDVPPPTGVSAPGAAYRVRCPDDPPNSQRPLRWLPDAQAPGLAEMARLAVTRLVLPQPRIELNPPVSTAQLVGLPTWLWVEPVWWTARSAGVSVPGVTVRATATPVRVAWSMGDGATVTCEGSGTPYTVGVADPVEASPDCGHIYTRASAGGPGGAFRVSATVTWRVSWSGGGASGSAGPLFSTATVPVTVVQVRSVNAGGAR